MRLQHATDTPVQKLKAYTAAESFATIFEELFREPADQTTEIKFAIAFPSGPPGVKATKSRSRHQISQDWASHALRKPLVKVRGGYL